MRKRSVIVATTAVLALGAVPAGAVSSPKYFKTGDCRAEAVAIPIPRDKAAQELPPGFEPGVGAASQSDVPYIYFESIVCGDPAAPTLTIATSYLWAVPPSRYQTSGSGARFVLSAAMGGTDAALFAQSSCVGDAFVAGDITQVEHVRTPDAAATDSTVVSEVLSASWSSATGTLLTEGAGSTRWFYESERGVRFFDVVEVIDLLGLGTGAIRFDQPFLDLPPVASGIARSVDAEMIVPTRKCSA